MSKPVMINVEALGPLVEKMVTNFMTKGNTSVSIPSSRYNQYKGVGDVLRTLRLARRLTMNELGLKIGVSASYISRIESGTRRINMDLIQQFCKIYDLTPAELMENVQLPVCN